MAVRRRSKAAGLPRLGPLAGLVVGATDRAAFLLERLGVERRGFRALLATKLAMDERRSRRERSSGGGMWSRGLMLTCLTNLAFGLFAGGMLLVADDPVLGMGSAQMLILGMASLVLVGDYSSVLLDDTDVAVVAPLPVDDRTFFVARVVHIGAYLTLACGSLAVGPLVLGCLRYPVLKLVPVLLVSTSASVALALTLSLGIYVVAARIFDAERFKDVVLAVQVASMVVFMAGLQLMPQLLATERAQAWLEQQQWWLTYVLPPFHQGGLFALVLGDTHGNHVALAVLALLLPALAVVTMLRLAGRGFLAGLAAQAAVARRRRRRRRRGWLPLEPECLAGYEFCRALSRRDRGFRMRAYPTIAMSLVLGLVFVIRGEIDLGSATLCGAIYFVGLQGPPIVFLSRFSDTWEGRWMFQALPMKDPGAFVGGAMLALVTTLLLPLLIGVTALVLVLGGRFLALDALFAFLATLAITLIAIHTVGREFPFSRKPSRDAHEGRTATLFGLSMVTVVIMLVHVALHFVPWGLVGGDAVLIVVDGTLLRGLRRLTVPTVRFTPG